MFHRQPGKDTTACCIRASCRYNGCHLQMFVILKISSIQPRRTRLLLFHVRAEAQRGCQSRLVFCTLLPRFLNAMHCFPHWHHFQGVPAFYNESTQPVLSTWVVLICWFTVPANFTLSSRFKTRQILNLQDWASTENSNTCSKAVSFYHIIDLQLDILLCHHGHLLNLSVTPSRMKHFCVPLPRKSLFYSMHIHVYRNTTEGLAHEYFFPIFQ